MGKRSDFARRRRPAGANAVIDWPRIIPHARPHDEAEAVRAAEGGLLYIAVPCAGRPVAEVLAYGQAARARLRLAGASVTCPGVDGVADAAHEWRLSEWDHAQWMASHMPLLSRATVVWVLDAPGWRESRGCFEEAQHAVEHGKPLFLPGEAW